ncbi:MAG TPA: hypothetical protein VIW45_20405 [Vicinamibacterales bacterium]|jgi:hypothetical protein
MKKAKPRRTPRGTLNRTVMVMPRQSADEIWRRRAIRETLHDLKAVIVRGKTTR